MSTALARSKPKPSVNLRGLFDSALARNIIVKTGIWFTFADHQLGPSRAKALAFLADDPAMVEEIADLVCAPARYIKDETPTGRQHDAMRQSIEGLLRENEMLLLELERVEGQEAVDALLRSLIPKRARAVIPFVPVAVLKMRCPFCKQVMREVLRRRFADGTMEYRALQCLNEECQTALETNRKISIT